MSAAKLKSGGTPQPAAPSRDVATRLKTVEELLGKMTVPLQPSEAPDDLIYIADRPKLTLRERDDTGEKRPVLDPMTFQVLAKTILSQTKNLRSQLGGRLELLSINAEAAPTSNGRWYYRIEDGKGQKMDVLFGSGLWCGARVFMYDHAGRNSMEKELDTEATEELARILLGARIPDAPKVEFDPEEDLSEEDKAELKETARRTEELRQGYQEGGKGFLENMVKKAPLKWPTMVSEIERKKSDDFSQADLERILSTISNQVFSLSTFSFESYDGSRLRLSNTNDDGDESAIEIYLFEDDNGEKLGILSVAHAPPNVPESDVSTPLESSFQIADDLDDEYLASELELEPGHSLGFALLKYAVAKSDVPVDLDDDDELVNFFKRDPAAEKKAAELRQAERDKEKQKERNKAVARAGRKVTKKKTTKKTTAKKKVAKKKVTKKKVAKKKAVRKKVVRKKTVRRRVATQP